ncbi:MAG TPA: tRNA adenosine(34) deaminase TadA [Clostridiales bacterium]|nr:tRNA adenosine(34) deaminase TadA [Clostridiales bacterium]
MDYYVFMREAIKEAEKAAGLGDVPVGAVAVYEGQIIGRGHNGKERKNDPISHAETEALRKAAQYLKTWRLKGVALFVTMEPCPMCAGAILQGRVDTLVFGAWDSRWGACGSTLNLLAPGLYNHKTEVIGGIMEKECAALTENFFRTRRQEPL